MKFVDRTEEQSRLSRSLSGNKAAFIVVYGRRRCGKSTLLKKMMTSRDIYFMADQTESSHQLMLLSKAVSSLLPGFDQVIYPDWETLFDNLNHRLSQRITLCLDEFPYLAKSAPQLPGIIQKLIDKGDNKFNLVLCGSSQQLMHGLVLDSAAPLYGRADQILKIRPMKLPYLQEILECADINAIEEYAVWGGVPRYWELRLQESSLEEALTYHLLSPYGILYDEPLRLFLDDMRDTVQSSTILSVIGNGVNRLSEIATRLEKPATSLSAPLEKLIQLGYLEREIPFNENPRNTKKSLYKIADPFMNFYFTFVVPNRSLIELGHNARVMELIHQRLSGYVSFIWEKLCRDSVPGMQINGITFGVASRWWGSISRDEKIELDVVAESTDGKYLLVGECKWTEGEYAERLLSNLVAKARELPFLNGRILIPRLYLKKEPLDGRSDSVLVPKDIISLLK